MDIPRVGDELDEDTRETICEKLREKKDKIRSKNWCFDYVLYETKEQIAWQINDVYEHGTLISYLVYTYYLHVL
jgi:hypothetical protein